MAGKSVFTILTEARKSKLGWDTLTHQSQEEFACELIEDLISVAVDYGAESYRLKKADIPAEELIKGVEDLEVRLGHESERMYAFIKGALK